MVWDNKSIQNSGISCLITFVVLEQLVRPPPNFKAAIAGMWDRDVGGDRKYGGTLIF